MTTAEIRTQLDAARQRRDVLDSDREQLALPSMSDAKARARHHKVTEEIAEIDRDIARHGQALERAAALEAQAREAALLADAESRRAAAREIAARLIASAKNIDNALATISIEGSKLAEYVKALGKTGVTNMSIAPRFLSHGAIARAAQAAGAAGVLGTERVSHAHAQPLAQAAESLLGAAIPRSDGSKAA